MGRKWPFMLLCTTTTYTADVSSLNLHFHTLLGMLYNITPIKSEFTVLEIHSKKVACKNLPANFAFTFKSDVERGDWGSSEHKQNGAKIQNR